jgi:protein-tyrosine sulfotransferase
MHEMTPDPIIVFGAPRSGTTYLNAILNAHPDVFVTHETRVFAWLHRVLRVVTAQPQMLNTHKSEYIEFLERTLPDVVRSFYRELRPNVRHWGDKNPHYASPVNEGCLDTILELFPGTKYLHIVRDGRDVVTSLIRKKNPKGESWTTFEQAHEIWLEHVSNGRGFVAAHPGICLEMRYEELIGDDEGHARRVFEFLEIPFSDAVAAFCAEQVEERTPLSGPTRDLSDAGRSEWSLVLDAQQQARSMELIGAELRALGYA